MRLIGKSDVPEGIRMELSNFLIKCVPEVENRAGRWEENTLRVLLFNFGNVLNL